MSIIFHASDIHFGRSNPEVAAALKHEIDTVNPAIAVFSGDFTQTGTAEEFQEARDFLSSLSCPIFTVPGNHDIPYKNLFHRFFTPYARYREYINSELCPALETEDAFIVGLNTARRFQPHWNWAHGRVSDKQIEYMRQTFKRAPLQKYKILVCHHPLMDLTDMPIKTIVWGREKLRAALLDLNVHMVLSGHIHHASLTYESDADGRISYVGAATATSTRLRTHQNGYNLITIDGPEATVEHRAWTGNGFEIFDINKQKSE